MIIPDDICPIAMDIGGTLAKVVFALDDSIPRPYFIDGCRNLKLCGLFYELL